MNCFVSMEHTKLLLILYVIFLTHHEGSVYPISCFIVNASSSVPDLIQDIVFFLTGSAIWLTDTLWLTLKLVHCNAEQPSRLAKPSRESTT